MANTTQNKLNGIFGGFCLLVICLVIFFFFTLQIFCLWIMVPMLCFYGISVSASVRSLHLHFSCVFALAFLPCLFVLYCPNIFSFVSFLFPFLLPIYFLVRKKEHLWVLVTREMGRIWEGMGEGDHDHNIVYEQICVFN